MKKLCVLLNFVAAFSAFTMPDLGFVDPETNATFVLLTRSNSDETLISFELSKPVSGVELPSGQYSIAEFRQAVRNDGELPDALREIFFDMLEQSLVSHDYEKLPHDFFKSLNKILKNVPKCFDVGDCSD